MAQPHPYSSTFIEDVDRLIVAGECRPVVIPMPDCWTAYGGSQFIDSAGTGEYMTYLCDELVPFVDERFNTIAERDARAVQGKSSGGYGALVLPMLRPELWGGLGDVSGDAAFEYCYLPDFPRAWAMLREHDSIEAFWESMLADPTPSPAMFAAVNAIAMAACYSPGPDGEPELPFDARATARCARTSGSAGSPGTRCGCCRPPRRPALDARDLARVRAPGRVQPATPGPRSCTRSSSEAGIEHRFELFEGKHGGLTPRYAPLVAWLAERLAWT